MGTKNTLRLLSSIKFAMPEPFSFELTVSKPAGWHWSTPAEKFENGSFWTGLRLDGRPIGLKMEAAGRLVTAYVYGSSDTGQEWSQVLEPELRKALGAEEDIAGFYRFARSEPLLKEVNDHLYGMRLGRPRDVFGRVILAICLQMAPLKRSRQMMALILSEFGAVLDFDRHRVTLWPSPETVAALGPSALREKARLGYRSERLVAAAKHLADSPLSITALDALPDEEASRVVAAIPGIGQYSSAIVLGRGHVPLDSWSVVILSELLLGKSPQLGRREIPDLSRFVEQHWGHWGWLAFAYIVNDLPYLARKYELSRTY